MTHNVQITRSTKQKNTSVEVIDVTPKLAAEWLERNDRNRKIRTHWVDALARDMREGNWMFNAEPVRFDRNGTLLDGQHRLHAVIRSKLTQRFLVVRDLEPETQRVTDIGRARSLGDQLNIDGVITSGSNAAALGRLLVRYDKWGDLGRSGQNQPSNAEIREFIEAHVDEVHRAVVVGNRARNRGFPVAPAVFGMCYFVCARRDRTAADSFFIEQLAEGVGLTPDSPARALLVRLRSDHHSDHDTVCYVFHAWNHFRRGTGLVRLNAPKGGWDSENRPVPR